MTELPLPLRMDDIERYYNKAYKILDKHQLRFQITIAMQTNGEPDIDSGYVALFKVFAMLELPHVIVNQKGRYWGWNDVDKTYQYATDREAKMALAMIYYSQIEYGQA